MFGQQLLFEAEGPDRPRIIAAANACYKDQHPKRLLRILQDQPELLLSRLRYDSYADHSTTLLSFVVREHGQYNLLRLMESLVTRHPEFIFRTNDV